MTTFIHQPKPRFTSRLPESTLFGVSGARTRWQDDAVCAQVDTELFHPKTGNEGGRIKNAKKVCAGCSVIAKCAEYAIADPELSGVWGGLTDKERELIRNERRVIAEVVKLVPMARRATTVDQCVRKAS